MESILKPLPSILKPLPSILKERMVPNERNTRSVCLDWVAVHPKVTFAFTVNGLQKDLHFAIAV